MKAPNILWICTDQQRWDTLGCYANPYVTTPHLDRLAETSAVFDHAYCQSPVCTPSRASFMTGRYARATRCRQNGQDIPDDEVLVTKRLAENDYNCGLAGKLHLSACHPTVCPEMERRIDDGYSTFHWSHHPMGGWGEANEYWKWLSEKGAKYDISPYDECKWVHKGMPDELSQTSWCVEKACDFISKQSHEEKPWLFSLNLFDPHHPFDPPEDRMKTYLDRLNDIPLPDYQDGELAQKSVYQRMDHKGAYGGHAGLPYDKMSEADHRWVRASYWAMCDLVDAQIGRLLDHLEATGQRENTMIIFMSDHGEMLGDHGIYLKGPYFYEPAVRVPLLVSLPGVIAPRKSKALVELVDLAPTFMEAAGLDPDPAMQGQSLWSLLTDGKHADQHRDDVFCEYYNAMSWHKDPPAHCSMWRDKRYKIVVDHKHSNGELYDLLEDPKEFRNLWDDPQYAAVKSEALLKLNNRQAWTVDPMPAKCAEW